MMRSLFSGVAGLKTHQTRMDVLGNNIANVNTVGFKGSSANFSDTFYQTVSSATGPNAATAAAGTNAKQIGLGSKMASITTNITEQGGTSSTNRALDIAINGESFLVVNSGGMRYFSKAGALNVDPNGTLYSTTNGATIQGWLADDEGNVSKDVVKDLTIMTPDKMYYEPTATSKVTVTGNIDKADKDLQKDEGLISTISFYDNLGQQYTAQLSYKPAGTGTATVGGTVDANGTVTGGTAVTTTDYTVELVDIFDEEGNSIFVEKQADGTYVARTSVQVQFGAATYNVTDASVNKQTGKFTLTSSVTAAADKTKIQFNSGTGKFVSVANSGFGKPINPDAGTSTTAPKYTTTGILLDVFPNGTGTGGGTGGGTTTGATSIPDTFVHYNAGSDDGGVSVDMHTLTQYSSSSVSNVSYKKGIDGEGTGNVSGKMKGISIDEDGFIYGTYNNGAKKCLGQIAVATFSNASGLEAVGDSMFAQSNNSGEFDGVGEEISLTGSFTVGALEMSNVDLASEFTTMIITQRGFQANSRIITTSDSMLEEIVSLKR